MKNILRLSLDELNRLRKVAVTAMLSWIPGTLALVSILGAHYVSRLVITLWFCIAFVLTALYVCLFFHYLLFRSKDR
jgi:hypothetical protein